MYLIFSFDFLNPGKTEFIITSILEIHFRAENLKGILKFNLKAQ